MRHDGCWSGQKCEIGKYKPGDILERFPNQAEDRQLGIYLGDRELDSRVPCGFGQGQEPHTVAYLHIDRERGINLNLDGHYCGNIELAGWKPTGSRRENIANGFLSSCGQDLGFAKRWLTRELESLSAGLNFCR